jgi:hypothetical protein
MPRKFDRVRDTKYIIDALINGDFKQAKKRTLKGLKVLLSDESCVDHQEAYRCINKMPLYPIRKNQADELAQRVCDVLIRMSGSFSTKLEPRHRYNLMIRYRNLFK